jgi:hypothetical protein
MRWRPAFSASAVARCSVLALVLVAGCGGQAQQRTAVGVQFSASHLPDPRGPVPCPLTHHAGANGVQSCWAKHTGVTAATGFSEAQILAGHSSLKHVVGNVVITTRGKVISNEWIDGCVSIKADDVTIENSLIHTRHACSGGNGGTAPSAINNGQGTGSPTGTLVQDTTVDGMDPGNGSSGNSFGISLGPGSTCRRCNAFGFAKNYWTNGSSSAPSRIVDSYSHDNASDWAKSPKNPGCPHENGIYLNTSDYVKIQHTYSILTGAGYCVTGAISNLADYGRPHDYTVVHSYAEGVLGADLYTGRPGKCGTPRIAMIRNALSRDNGWGGTDTINYWTDKGNVWRGNYVPETGRPYPEPPTVKGC